MHVQTGDSKSVGYTDAAAGSRVARTMAAAVVEACRDALRQLGGGRPRSCSAPPEVLDYAARRIPFTRSRAVPPSPSRS